MKLLQRYILWELVRVFTLLLLGLTVMLVFVGVLREAAERDLAPGVVIQIIPFIVPSLMPFTIPATILLAVTVVYGRMAGDLEITAVKSAGVHPLRLLAPAYLLGAILTFASFFMTDRAIPWAIANIETVVTQAMEDIFLSKLKSSHFISAADGYSILVDDVQGNTLITPSFTYRDSNHQQIKVKAETAKVEFDVSDRKAKLSIRNAQWSVAGRDAGGTLDQHYFEFDLKDELGGKKARHLTLGDIRDQLVELAGVKVESRIQHNQEVVKLLMLGDFEQLSERAEVFDIAKENAATNSRHMSAEIHTRYAMAGSCLFFTLLGGPFAILQARRQFITSFIMCFLPILLVYYPITFLMVNLCKTGTLAPWWSMWVPNVLIGIASYFVLRRVIRY